MMETGFPAQTETKDSWAVTDQEGRTNGQEKQFCFQECNKLSYLIQSKLKAHKWSGVLVYGNPDLQMFS